MRLNSCVCTVFLCAVYASAASAQEEAQTQRKALTDAVGDFDYVHVFDPLQVEHGGRIVIDRFHNTIYRQYEGPEIGTDVMLDILERDGFRITYLDDEPTPERLDSGDVLIMHGLPSDEIELPGGDVSYRSGLSDESVDAIVRHVDSGGGLFLALSHFPGGTGAKALLDAFAVQFRDGYLWHESAPSFNDPVDGTCSHFFGMSPQDGTVRSNHPALAGGLPVERVDFLCGAAVFREPADVILGFPPGSRNYLENAAVFEVSDHYAGVIGFPFGQGRVVIATDQGMFRNFILTFDETEDVYVTLTSPHNDNADLMINLMRWLSKNAPADLEATR